MIYFDNAATTPLLKEVKQDIYNNMELYGNPSAMYEWGLITKRRIEEVRNIVAETIKCEPNQVYFTSGASESNSWILSQFDSVYMPNRAEHHSISNNPRIRRYPTSQATTHMLVNNETGLIYDLSNYHDTFLHSDCTQVIGNIPINVKDMGLDAISFSGHKIGAPKGVGVLYSNKPLVPLIYGGKQEQGVRGGTENFLGISALGVALEHANKNLIEKKEHSKMLSKYLLKSLTRNNIDFTFNAEGCKVVPNILSLRFSKDKEYLMLGLEQQGIYVSSGSACDSGNPTISQSLLQLGLNQYQANRTLRISWGLENTKEEIDEFVSVLCKLL